MFAERVVLFSVGMVFLGSLTMSWGQDTPAACDPTLAATVTTQYKQLVDDKLLLNVDAPTPPQQLEALVQEIRVLTTMSQRDSQQLTQEKQNVARLLEQLRTVLKTTKAGGVADNK